MWSDKLTNNQTARKHGIPKWLRRYQARYGKGGALALVAAHKQSPALMLDHGRDRTVRLARQITITVEGGK